MGTCACLLNVQHKDQTSLHTSNIPSTSTMVATQTYNAIAIRDHNVVHASNIYEIASIPDTLCMKPTEIVSLTATLSDKRHLTLPKCSSHSVSSQNHMISSHIPPESPPIHPSPSPPLTSQYSHTFMTLSASHDHSNTCSCHLIHQSTLDIVTLPSIWCIQHDDMLKYMLSRHEIPLALFEMFRDYLYVDGSAILKVRNGAYHKRIRNGLRSLQFCPCWYDEYLHGLRIMQFGFCPGTTQFALKFTSKDTDKFHYSSFESRSRFATKIRMDANDARTDLGLEIFDMNIAEFPTMIPSYIDSYDPHVILLLFDVADRSSFDGIIKMRKSLQNLYESLEEKSEYDHAIIHPNRSNLKRFHNSFDALASVFGFGYHPNAESHAVAEHKKRSHSVTSLLCNISSSIKQNVQKQNEKKLKRASTHSHFNHNKVDESNKNNFTIVPLHDENICCDEDTSCTSCYYHNNEQTQRDSMPPVLIVGIHADIDQKERNVSIEEALELSKKWEIPYIETSALNGNNVKDVFIECVRTRWFYDTFPKFRMRSSAMLLTE